MSSLGVITLDNVFKVQGAYPNMVIYSHEITENSEKIQDGADY
jgi:hypothetical protein